jgi:hypothetical protein
MRRLTWHLKRIGETDSESEVLEMVNHHECSIVLRRDERFVVYEYATEDNADATLVSDADTELRLDDFTAAVYAVYRPNTGAAFSPTFGFALVMTYEGVRDDERDVPETEPTVVSD